MNEGEPVADLRSIDLNLLVVFQHLLEDANLSAVARRLGRSQPAISNALRRLRETLGDELFVRTPQGMLPTPYAEHLAGPLAEALSMLAQTLESRPDFDPHASTRRFRIAMSDVGEIHFMPHLMNLCLRRAPGVRIESARLSGEALQRELDAGHVDLALGPFNDLCGGVMQRLLFRQGYATLFRKGHPRAGAGMSLKAFRAERHLRVTHAAPYGQIEHWLEKAGVALGDHFSVPHFTAVPYIVSSTDLLATVPRRLADDAAARFGLQWLTPSLRMPALQTYLYWHRRFHRDGGNQWLRELIVGAFAQRA